MSDGVPVDSAVPATPVEAQMDAATPVEATMTTAAEGADEGTAEESNDVHAEEVAVVNDDGTPSEPAAASDPSDAAPAATAVPAGPPGPPPGAPPVGGNGIPPGPPPGAPNSQQSYAAPVMRFGAYTAPPMYPPPIQPNFPPTIPPFMPGGPMMMPNFPPPLPPGWSEHTAPDGLTKYYYNSQTRESTYSRPSFAPLPNGMPPPINNAQAAIPEKKKKKEKPKEKVAIPGTGWQRITTSEGNVFYFEKETKRSEWSVPDEIKEEVAELEADEKRLKDEALKQEKEKREADRLERLREQERVRAEIEEERKKKLAFIAAKRKAAAEAQEGESKRPKTEPAVQDEGTEAAQDPDERQDEDEDEAYGPQDEEDEEEWMKAVAAEFAQADQEKQEQEEKARQATQLNTEEAAKQIFAVPQKVNVSLEEQRALFKALLMEKDISPFAPWDQSLPLFINDPRYILLASEKDRREVYEDYCRDVGRARRLKKTSATTSAAETKKADPEKGYKALLREDVTSTRTRWDDFRRKWKKDRRFYAFGRDDREREKVFKTHLKELGERKRADAQRAELDFYELLREQSNLSSSSVWAEVKKSISSDTRYDAVGSSTLRAELFEGFIRKLASSSATANETPEQIAERKLAERKAKQEASLRERQAKVGAEKERVEREVGKSKAGAGREDGERIFGSLLVDQIRDHEVAWNDASRFLSTDPRFNHPSLMLGDKRRLFEQHISRISAKRSNALHDLFAANTPQLDTPYDEVYPKIIEDPIVQRAGLDVHSLEDRWNTWKRHREMEARTEFNQMLGENSFVDFWGKMRKKQTDEAAAKVMKDQEDEEDAEEEQDRDLSELAQQIDLKEVKAVLRRDKRYRQFDHIPEEREQWIKEYLDGLEAASGSKTVHNVGGGR